MTPANKITAEKLSNALNAPWRHPLRCIPETGEEEVMRGVYEFSLHDEARSSITTLTFATSDPTRIEVDIAPADDYHSRILFEGVTEVKYDPTHRLVEFRRETTDTMQVLTVMGRGQIDMVSYEAHH